MFRRKPINRAPVLRARQIDGEQPAFDAYQAVIDAAAGLKGSDFDKFLRALPSPWRVVWTSIWLDCEVKNGGFHQFFWNSDGEWNNETLEDLRLLEAAPFILLFEEALDVFKTHDYASDKKSSGNSWAGFTDAYQEGRMNSLDDAYYNVKNELPEYLNDYIRSNRAKYLDGAK